MQQEGTESTGGVQEADALETVETTAPEISEGTETGVTDNDAKAEPVRETVARALDLERKKLTGDDSKAEGAAPQKAEPVRGEVGKPKVKKDKEGQFDPEMFPPDRLHAPEKEVFNQLPMPLKKAWHRAIKDLEASTTRNNQEMTRATTEARGVVEAVQPFAKSWGERGFTVPSAIAALAAANEKLTDPKTSKDAYLALGRDIGIDFEEVAAIARGETPAGHVAPVTSHPEFIAMRNEINALKSEGEQFRSKQLNETVSSIAAEMAAVRDEQDQFGHYLYPEMHEEGFFERAKPLVSALRGTVPGLSYGDALRRAHASMTGKSGVTSPALNQPSLRPNDTQTNTRALSAAVSVRGRTAPQVSGMTIPDKIPDSVRATTEMALAQLRRGT